MSLFLPFVFPSDLGFAKRRCVSVCEKEEKEIADFFCHLGTEALPEGRDKVTVLRWWHLGREKSAASDFSPLQSKSLGKLLGKKENR